jgi:hypothetical protein
VAGQWQWLPDRRQANPPTRAATKERPASNPVACRAQATEPLSGRDVGRPNVLGDPMMSAPPGECAYRRQIVALEGDDPVRKGTRGLLDDARTALADTGRKRQRAQRRPCGAVRASTSHPWKGALARAGDPLWERDVNPAPVKLRSADAIPDTARRSV